MKVYFGSENINELIQGAMDKIKVLIDSSTIIGEKIVTDEGNVIIPISKVTVGYVVGGGEYADLSTRKKNTTYPMAGGSSGGVSVSPVGFLIEKDGEISYISVENKTAYQTILNLFNTIMAKISKEQDSEQEN